MGMCGVSMVVCGCAQVCAGVGVCVCASGCAWVWAGVHGYVWVFAGVQEGGA